jgi:hypothetical protein
MKAPNGKRTVGPFTAALAIVTLLVGVGIGVALDRYVLRQTPSRPAIVGKWAGVPDGENIAFNADGTFDFERAVMDMSGEKSVWKTSPASGQWRWVDDERVEIRGYRSEPEASRVAVAGDTLKLLKPDGGVKEYRRK